jgi:nucleoside phosphorylase
MAEGKGLVVCALAREASKIRTTALPHSTVVMGPGGHFAGAFSMHLEQAAEKPAWALLAGYSGSLDASVCPGDIVHATSVRDSADAVLNSPLSVSPQGTGVHRRHRGMVYSSESLVCHPAEKARLGMETKALAVDMESMVFASLCNRFGIPWGIIRCVFDSVHDPLHPKMLRWCDSRGNQNTLALAWDLALSPGWWWRVPGWGKRDRLAGKAMAGSVENWIRGQTA